MSTESLTIDATRAAVLYTALDTAIGVIRSRLELKSASPYVGAIKMQLASYESEKALLARSFPELTK